MKPVTQLSEAINELMIQRADECKYYVTLYRYVAKPLAIGAQYIHHSDIFNGARPTRIICYQKSQACYNGDHTLTVLLHIMTRRKSGCCCSATKTCGKRKSNRLLRPPGGKVISLRRRAIQTLHVRPVISKYG